MYGYAYSGEPSSTIQIENTKSYNRKRVGPHIDPTSVVAGAPQESRLNEVHSPVQTLLRELWAGGVVRRYPTVIQPELEMTTVPGAARRSDRPSHARAESWQREWIDDPEPINNFWD